MPQIAIINISIGFFALILGAAAGPFIVTYVEEAFLYDETLVQSWFYTLYKSAHGHFSLLAIIQVLFGLSLHLTRFNPLFKNIQTIGFSLGLIAMGPVLFLKSYFLPIAEELFFIDKKQ